MTEEMQARVRKVREDFSQSGYPQQFGGVEQAEIMLPMADGVRLRTLVIRPQGLEEAPCILVRSCYPHEEAYYREVARQYALRGFGYVVQFCRGTGGSEGMWEPNVNERADGKAALDWLCGQSWVRCAGCWGVSYLALTGWLVADLLPPKVKTMYLTMYGTFRHTSAYKDGLFRHDVLTAWAMGNAGFPVTAGYRESCLYRPHVRVDEALWGRRVDWYRRWVTSTDRTDPYWNEGVWKTLQEIPSRVKVPISMSEGWYDHHLGSGIETYRQLSEECKSKSEFLIGPWNHWFEAPLEGEDGTRYETNDLIRAFAWFHRILVEQEQPKARVARYVIGRDRWMEHSSLDIPGGKTVCYYLSGGENGLVSVPEEIVGGERGYWYNPEDPVSTHGGESMLESKAEIGSLLQPGPDYREDVLSFVSAPLERELAVCGVIRAKLYVSSDAEDTAFVVRVMEVRGGGRAYNVRGGITTLAYRNGAERRRDYTPGETVEITVSMWDIAWQFRRGSRIRIDVQSSDFPQYAVHSNTAGVWAEQTEIKTARQTVYFGRQHLSRIELPALEEQQLCGSIL